MLWWSLSHGKCFGGHCHMASALAVTITWRVFQWSLTYGECFHGHYHMVSALVLTVIWWGLEEVCIKYLLVLKQCTMKEAAILGTGTHWEVGEMVQSVKGLLHQQVDRSLGPQHSGGKADCVGTHHPLSAVELEKWASVELPGQFLHLNGRAPGSVKNPVSKTKADTWQISTFGLHTCTYVHIYLHAPVCKQTNVYTYIHGHKLLTSSPDCVFFVFILTRTTGQMWAALPVSGVSNFHNSNSFKDKAWRTGFYRMESALECMHTCMYAYTCINW